MLFRPYSDRIAGSISFTSALVLIDSHCHLDFKELNHNNNLESVIKRAISSGVGLMQTICTKVSDFQNILSIANKYSMIYCSAGVHPLYIDDIVSVEHLLDCCKYEKVIGIGETGLDYYREGFDKKKQRTSFINHIIAAQRSGLPLIIHVRSADEDLVCILREMRKDGEFSGVIHCFTASRWLAENCIDMGLYISASGIITFKNSVPIQEIFKSLPEKSILIETDAPFLAPVPYRGQVNQPIYIKETALFLAKLRAITYDEICNITTNNFFRLFKKANIVLNSG